MKLPFKHGHASRGNWTPTYRSWSSMIKRCSQKRYKRYFGRGIIVEKKFHNFLNFLKYMGERPKGMTLDRIDADGNYETGNMRWATMEQQVRNIRPLKGSSSKYKGVSLLKRTGKWRASIKIKGKKQKHLGFFTSQKEAAKAYNKAALEAWGTDCYLNPI